MIAIDRVVPYARNPRRNAASVAKVAASIREFGWRQPIVTGVDYQVIVGHTRLLAARQLGLSEVPVHVADGLTPAQCRAYRLADNRTQEDAEWDDTLLAEELQLLVANAGDLRSTAFDEDELAALLARDITPDAQTESASAEHPIVTGGWAVLVTCTSEREQVEFLARCIAEGIRCKALIV